MVSDHSKSQIQIVLYFIIFAILLFTLPVVVDSSKYYDALSSAIAGMIIIIPVWGFTHNIERSFGLSEDRDGRNKVNHKYTKRKFEQSLSVLKPLISLLIVVFLEFIGIISLIDSNVNRFLWRYDEGINLFSKVVIMSLIGFFIYNLSKEDDKNY